MATQKTSRGRIPIIREFFENPPHGRKVTMAEMKALTMQERAELGDLAAAEMGLTRVEEDGKILFVGS